MKSEIKLAFLIIEKIVNFMTYFIDQKKKKERENETQKIQDDPVDWFNDRYSKRVSSSGADETKPETGSDDQQTER